MNNERLTTVHNTSILKQRPTMVTITHPHHPLHGRQFEFVGLYQSKQLRVVIRLPEGNTARLPVDYTDYTATRVEITENDELMDSTNLLSIEGLLHVVKIVDEIKKRNSHLSAKKVKR